MSARIITILIIAILIIVDLLSKYLVWNFVHSPINILPVFSILPIINKGVSFSLLNQTNYKLILFIEIVVTIVLIVMLIRSKYKSEIIALGLIIGGSLGNLINRLFLHHVIDFISLHFKQYYFPIFNFADTFITLGIILIIIKEIRVIKCKKK